MSKINKILDYTTRKTAEILGVSTAAVDSMVAKGILSETSAGTIPGADIVRLQMRRDVIATNTYARLKNAMQVFESLGCDARKNFIADAMRHFEKEINAIAEAEWKKWHAEAEKAFTREVAEIERSRIEQLKALGF